MNITSSRPKASREDDSGPAPSSGVSVLILSLATALCLLPFVTKAFHIDDPLFLWSAQQIQKHPTNPNGFDVNWTAKSEPMSAVTKNPPGNAYFIAAVASVIGYSEPALHLAFLIPAVLVVVGTFLLGRWFCRHPLLAALMTLFTPGFLVSASTVMCDVPMLALWVFAVYFWLRAVDENSHRFYFVSAVLIVLCTLTKYFGITLLPLLAAYSVWKLRRPGLWILHFTVPVAALIAYQVITAGLYGHGLMTTTLGYVTEIPKTLGTWTGSTVLVGLAFSGGCVATVLLFSRRLHSRLGLGVGLLVALGIAVVVTSASAIGQSALPPDRGARALIGMQFGLLAVGGIGLCALTLSDFLKHKTAESALLLLWVGGTFVFATFVNWTTNGRSILPLVPAASFVLLRRLEARRGMGERLSLRQVVTPLAGAALLALMVTWGDFTLANVSRTAAVEIHKKYPSRPVWFQGHWGFQYYMEGYGARPIDVSAFKPSVHDLIVVPTINSYMFELPSEWARPVERIELPIGSIVSTMNPACGAGFYANVYGALPFSFNRQAPDRYTVYEVY